jgi:hypothetical protein
MQEYERAGTCRDWYADLWPTSHTRNQRRASIRLVKAHNGVFYKFDNEYKRINLCRACRRLAVGGRPISNQWWTFFYPSGYFPSQFPPGLCLWRLLLLSALPSTMSKPSISVDDIDAWDCFSWSRRVVYALAVFLDWSFASSPALMGSPAEYLLMSQEKQSCLRISYLWWKTILRPFVNPRLM